METALDSAKLVQTYTFENWKTLVAVWKGGAQAKMFSVYQGEWSTVAYITVMCDSASRDAISRRMDEWIDNKTFADVV